MWRSNLNVGGLPPHYEIKENEDFIFLFYKGKKIANFGKGEDPTHEIKRKILRHYNTNKDKGKS